MIMWTYSASMRKDASCASCTCVLALSVPGQPQIFQRLFQPRSAKEQLSRHPFHSWSLICHIFPSRQDDVIELFGPFEGKTVARTLTGLGVVLLIFGTSGSALILGHAVP